MARAVYPQDLAYRQEISLLNLRPGCRHHSRPTSGQSLRLLKSLRTGTGREWSVTCLRGTIEKVEGKRAQRVGRSKSDTNCTGVTGAYSSVDVVPFSKVNGRDQWLFLGIKCQFKMID
jgi:hypothetical protein